MGQKLNCPLRAAKQRCKLKPTKVRKKKNLKRRIRMEYFCLLKAEFLPPLVETDAGAILFPCQIMFNRFLFIFCLTFIDVSSNLISISALDENLTEVNVSFIWFGSVLIFLNFV